MPLAIVTGASRGIGRALALRLARDGHTVACLARSADDLEALAREDHRLVPVPVDLTDPAALDEATGALLAAHGPCGILVNNAGYALRGAMEEVPIHAWRREFEVNVFAAFRLVQRVLPGMREARRGVIVQLSSVAGRVAPPLSGAYAATKFALEAASDALRIEVAPFGVHVVVVEPGPVSTVFAATAASESREVLGREGSPYRAAYERLADNVRALHAHAWSAEAVADRVARAIARPRPPARVAAYGWLLWTSIALNAVAQPLHDRLVARRMGIDRL